MEKKFISVSDIWRRGEDIPDIVTAIEANGVYHFDEYRRYGKANPTECLGGLKFLWDWKHGETSPKIDFETGDVLYDPSLKLDGYGWYENDLPQFGTTESTPKPRPQTNRTVNNYLKIIANLCEKLEFDWRKCSAAEFVTLTETQGECILKDDTARKYLQLMRNVVD